MPDSKTTVGVPSPVTWMCIRLSLNCTSHPGGEKRRPPPAERVCRGEPRESQLPFAWDTRSLQEYTRRLFFFADHSLLEIVFLIYKPNSTLFFRAQQNEFGCTSRSSFLIPKSSEDRQ